MKLKIVSCAVAALAVAALTAAPRVAEATVVTDTHTVVVSLDVPTAISITATTPGNVPSWTGANATSIPFDVTVASNDSAGYTFTFAGLTGFFLKGTTNTSITIPYTVSAVSGLSNDAAVYTSGNPGSIYGAASPGVGGVSTFDANVAAVPGITADHYSDTITVTITSV